MSEEVKERKGDSFLVDIIPPAKTASYPMIYICPRKKVILKGEKIGLDTVHEKFLKLNESSFDNTNIEETARLIGKTILEDSKIIQGFRKGR